MGVEPHVLLQQNASSGVVFTKTQLEQRRLAIMSESEFVVKRISLLGSLVCLLAANATRSFERDLPGSKRAGDQRRAQLTILLARLLIGCPFVCASDAEIVSVCSQWKRGQGR